MKISISEMNAYNTCRRQWQISSRNAFYLRPTKKSDTLQIGTEFHEMLAKMYINSYQAACEYVAEFDAEHANLLLNMLRGYREVVGSADRDRFRVLEVEHEFIYKTRKNSTTEFHGFIDMIVQQTCDQTIYAMEHKTCSAFRNEQNIQWNPQLMLYYLAMQQYVDQLNKQNKTHWHFGGIIFNEVRKLKKKNDVRRTYVTFSVQQLAEFKKYLNDIARQMQKTAEQSAKGRILMPDVGQMKCNMCQYKDMCEGHAFGNKPMTKEFLLKEFAEDLVDYSESEDNENECD